MPFPAQPSLKASVVWGLQGNFCWNWQNTEHLKSSKSSELSFFCLLNVKSPLLDHVVIVSHTLIHPLAYTVWQGHLTSRPFLFSHSLTHQTVLSCLPYPSQSVDLQSPRTTSLSISVSFENIHAFLTDAWVLSTHLEFKVLETMSYSLSP